MHMKHDRRQAVWRRLRRSRSWPPGVTRFRSTTMAAAMGGHVRVGLEDSLMIARGQLARVQCRAGRKDPQDRRGTRPRGRHARRCARDAGPQGRRQDGVLIMIEYKIREARIDDAEALDSALRDLSAAIGDTHMAGPADLVRRRIRRQPQFSGDSRRRRGGNRRRRDFFADVFDCAGKGRHLRLGSLGKHNGARPRSRSQASRSRPRRRGQGLGRRLHQARRLSRQFRRPRLL